MLKKIHQLTAKNQDGLALLEIQNAYNELVRCKPLISKRAKRITKNGKKVNTVGYEYALDTYDNNCKNIEDDFKKVEPFLTGDFKLTIPRKPTIVLQELSTFLKQRGYTQKGIGEIVKVINLYEKNLSWSTSEKEKRAFVISLKSPRTWGITNF